MGFLHAVGIQGHIQGETRSLILIHDNDGKRKNGKKQNIENKKHLGHIVCHPCDLWFLKVFFYGSAQDGP